MKKAKIKALKEERKTIKKNIYFIERYIQALKFGIDGKYISLDEKLKMQINADSLRRQFEERLWYINLCLQCNRLA